MLMHRKEKRGEDNGNKGDNCQNWRWLTGGLESPMNAQAASGGAEIFDKKLAICGDISNIGLPS